MNMICDVFNIQMCERITNWQLDESELRIIMHVAKPNVRTQHDKCNELVGRNEMCN